MNEKILIIDDDDNVRKPLESLLSAKGYDVISAENGEVGITLAKFENPDLVLADIMMPKVDGYQVIEALQQDAQTAAIPFVFLSAKSDQETIRNAAGREADGHIMKPYDPDELLKTIRFRLSKEKSDESSIQEPELLPNHLFVRDGEQCWLIRHDELKLVEAEGKYVRLYFGKEKPFINKSLYVFEERLPQADFFRVNRNQIVNLNWVDKMSLGFNGGLSLTLKDGVEIQMSRRAAQRFRSVYGL